ncbi:MAG: DUF1289 domain-containing protein [Gammaproteobacteria bacterium]|jgi:predicted Fe-S protein YdhL (DUF1289 family)
MNNTEEKIESPCVRNCCLDNDDICLGCHRSLSEITAWTAMSKQEQKVVLQNAKQRAAKSNNKFK